MNILKTFFESTSRRDGCVNQIFMMKFVGIALLVAVCVFVTAVEGRKNHKRTVRKEHNREASSRDERHKMMREAQKTRKANMGEPLATNDAAARKVESLSKFIRNIAI